MKETDLLIAVLIFTIINWLIITSLLYILGNELSKFIENKINNLEKKINELLNKK